ncbi:hypothetical protein BDZ89DRAFT_1137368 [Hymenopellis radicata]|nr:hypothetical protein BDZ89DRAFT_1137368 [Hymenopellis radicata]
MSLPRHDPPGFTDDFTTEKQKKGWSDIISSYMNTTWVNPQLTPQFYDATKTKEIEPTSNTKITWTAFPKKVKTDSGGNDQLRWKTADADRGVQDEYCEWSVQRNSSGKITKIVFCNEGPEYFDFLAKTDPEKLLQLYKALNPGSAADIKSTDIYGPDGKYNPTNKWNNNTDSGNIVHLIQINNTLSAECDLAGLASVLRVDGNGKRITDPEQLARCSGFGNPARNSDPTIGAAVNNLAWGGSLITLKNPVGLYIDSVNLSNVTYPGDDSFDPNDCWKWVRGKKGTYMRAVMEVPKAEDMSLAISSSMEILLSTAVRSQVCGHIVSSTFIFELFRLDTSTDYIKVSLTGRTSDTGGSNQIDPPRKCSEAPTHGPDRPPGPQEFGTSFAAVAALGTDHMALGLSMYR